MAIKNIQPAKILLITALTFTAPSAFAYLDPGTGSMLIQGLIAGIAMVALTVKTYWYRLKDWFSGNSPEEQLSQDPQADEQS